MHVQKINIFWFRRDLRLIDNTGLFHALQRNKPVLPIFIFDKHILDKLQNKDDRRVAFIYETLKEMQRSLIKMGSSIEVFYTTPIDAFKRLCKKYSIDTVYTNHDYEPYAIQRDQVIADYLKEVNVTFQSFKDQVIFEKTEISKDNGLPYSVFTPYSNKWKAVYNSKPIQSFSTAAHFNNFYIQPPLEFPSLEAMGFKDSQEVFPTNEISDQLILQYNHQRNFPAVAGTSRLGIHLRFGTISIRQLVRHCSNLSETFLNELIWREFYQMILWNYPHVGQGKAFKPAYDFIEWRKDDLAFEKWCKGETGYPIVDAGMRELNSTGFMHNRVRMITASFLTKHLLIDWRLGEAYFAEKLLDFDLASNNGGWQWAAGCGCDAAPYFRIFNPYLQTKKFDPQFKYIKKWVPEFDKPQYPKPIVDHEFARKRCLEVYQRGLNRHTS